MNQLKFRLEDIQAERGRRSLAAFIKAAWPVLEPSTPYVHGYHIDVIAEHLEAVSNLQIRNLVINMPPRFAKSLLVSVSWFCWTWINDPGTRWLYSSYGANLATRDSIKCRRVIESPWYKRHYGESFKLAGDQNEKRRFENDQMGYRIATSVGGIGTGEGGDFIICDDPHNVAEAESDAIRTATLEWWSGTMTTRGNNPASVRKVIVMQRVHEGDLSGYLLAQGGYDHLCLPMEYEEVEKKYVTKIGWSDPRTKAGELLWPERFTTKEVEQLKLELGSSTKIAGQLQQNPAPAGGAIFKEFWWRYWKPAGPEWDHLQPVLCKGADGETLIECPLVTLPTEFDEVAQSWDLSFKDTDKSDFVAGGVYARKQANIYMLDLSYAKRDFVDTVKAIREVTEKWPQTLIKLVEDKANGPAVISMLQAEIPGMIPVEPDGDKTARAYSVTPIVEAGNFYLPHPGLPPHLNGWLRGFKHEAETFPKAVHDDRVDQFTQMLRRWIPNSGIIIISTPTSVSLPMSVRPATFPNQSQTDDSQVLPYDAQGRLIPMHRPTLHSTTSLTRAG